MGFTLVDHFQPGSNVARAAEEPANCTTSTLPCSNERVSSGLSNDLLAKSPMFPPSVSCPKSTTSGQAGQWAETSLAERLSQLDLHRSVLLLHVEPGLRERGRTAEALAGQDGEP